MMTTRSRVVASTMVGLLAVFFVFVLDWHASTKPVSFDTRHLVQLVTTERRQHERQRRQQRRHDAAAIPSSEKNQPRLTFPGLSLGEDGSTIPDPDNTGGDGGDSGTTHRDKTCREFLFNFLNGTTDARDECVGFYNAWKAADCAASSDGNDENEKGNGNPASFFFSKKEGTVLWYDLLQFFGLDDENKRPKKNHPTTGGLDKQHTLDNGTVVDDDNVGMIDDYYENWECCSSITDFYGKHCRQNHGLDAFQLLAIMVGLVVCGVSKSILKLAGLQWIPDAGACIVVGSIIGGTVRLFLNNTTGGGSFQNGLIFDNDLFLQILLPPIIFEASLSIDKKAFRRDLFPILTLAIFGTFFSALAIGYGTYYLSAKLPLLDALVFGALMSSIDPVATLSILSGNGVNPRDTLYNLIFGESLLNDGVAIVLFNSLVRHVGDAPDVSVATLHDIWRDFLSVTISSLAIGVSCGAVCTMYFCALRGQHGAATEVAMFFTWALIPYYIADGLECSGIIAIMVMGFMLDYYVVGSDSLARRLEEQEATGRAQRESAGRWVEYMETVHPPVPSNRRGGALWAFLARAFSGKGHIDEKSRHHVGFVAHVIANLMETAIFGYLGLFLFNDKSLNVKMLASGLFSCIASRAVMVAGASFLINVFVFLDVEEFLGRLWVLIRNYRRHGGSRNAGINLSEDDVPEKLFLDRKTQLILFSAGVRGAVSYALVQNIPVYNAVTKHGSKFKTELRAMTSASIVTLIFGFGAMTYYLIQQRSNNNSGRMERTASSHALTDQLLMSEFTSSADVPDHNDGEFPSADHQNRNNSEYHHLPQQQQLEQQRQHPGLSPIETANDLLFAQRRPRQPAPSSEGSFVQQHQPGSIR